MDQRQRPSFLDAWLEDVRDDLRRYGPIKLVPWLLLFCVAVGVVVTLLVSRESFWDKPELSGMFFTATVTINGLLLALSWGSFAKIYELASEPKLAAFLRKHNHLRTYIFHVDFIHICQVIALGWSGFALVLSVIDHWPHALGGALMLFALQKISLAGVIASSIYALRYAIGAVRIMQDLVWYSTYFIGEGPERDITVHEGGRTQDLDVLKRN
jgi:hypothetical protein